MPGPGRVFDDPPACLAPRGNRAGGDWHLAVAAGNIEHIGRLAQPGDTAAERAHQALAGRDAGAEMRRTPGEIGVVK